MNRNTKNTNQMEDRRERQDNILATLKTVTANGGETRKRQLKMKKTKGNT